MQTVRSASNHAYVPVRSSPDIYFVRLQFVKLHKQLFHPSTEKLFVFYKTSAARRGEPRYFDILQDILNRSNPCRRIRHAQMCFWVSFGAENVRFNEITMVSIMYLNRTPVLNNVDESRRFKAAHFLPETSTKAAWRCISECWATTYTGLPNQMLVDQGNYFG